MIYLLTGDDEFAVEQAVKGLLETHQVHPWHYSCHRYGDMTELVDALVSTLTLTLDGSNQLLWLQDLAIHSNLPKANQIQALLSDLENSSASVVVISSNTIDGRSALAKWLKAHATCREHQRFAPWETGLLLTQAQAMATTQGLSLSGESAERLIAQVSNDTRALHQALELLALYGGEINPEIVERLVPAQASNGIAFSRALLNRDIPTAMAELERTMALNESPIRLLALTLSQLRLWIGVKAAVEQSPYANNAAIAQMISLPGNPNRVYHLKQEVRHTNLNALVGLLKLVLATERALKSGSDALNAMRQLILAVGKA